MDNYGNDYGFMSQEGYASIDFTLLDRPNSNIASAPESTAALLPDLHVGDSSFASFDFLDGPSVDAFGGVLREADEAHSQDQAGYSYDLQKNRKEQSLLEQSPASLHRGDGEPDSELPSSEYQIPFEAQKPISNLDFFSPKESGPQEQQAHPDPGNDATDGNHNYFEQGQVSQHTQSAAGAGSWYNSWPGSNSHSDETQVFLQTPSYDKNTAQLAGQMGYQDSQVSSADAVPKATHSFLPTAKQSDSRQASNMGLAQPSAQVNTAPSTVAKSSSRHHGYDYEGLMDGSSANQFGQSSSALAENTTSARRDQTSDANVGVQAALRGHAQGQAYKYAGQSLGTVALVNEVSPLKVNDYDFLGGQYAMKGQTPSNVAQQQSAVDEMQAWHQHPLLPQSNQQQASYQQPYQDLSRRHRHHVDQQSQNARQQDVQQFLAANRQSQSLGNQLSAFLTESSLQDISRVPERQNSQLATDNQRSLLQQPNYAAINNVTPLNWSAGGSDTSAMDGLAHDYLMGAQDQTFNWQALALKASGQVDPSAAYGSLPVNRKDTAAQPVAASYPGMQVSFQDSYGGSRKYSAANTQVEKPVGRNVTSETSGSSFYGGAYQGQVYDAAGNLHASTQGSKHQAVGKMPFWQNSHPQPVEQNRSGNNLGQSNVPHRSSQVPAAAQGRQQKTWTGLSGQQETLQGGIFAQNLANAEALKQSFLGGSSIQQSSHQLGDLRQSSRTQSIETAHYMQQSSSQAAASSQFLSALGTKAQNKWNRLNMQQSVPQTTVPAETSSSLEANQKSTWTSLNMQQASAETHSLANLNKQQNIWSGQNAQQRSRPATNSLHLFTDLDGRHRNSMQASHDLQQASAQPSGSHVNKIDVNLRSSNHMQSSSVHGNEAPSTLVDLETSQQQSGWRDHLLLQGTSQTYNDLDKTSSWRNIWQTPASGEGSPQLLDMDNGRQQNTLWGHNLQKSRSEAVESHVAPINSREQSAWSSQDVQESPQTDQLLSSLDTEQPGSHHSHSLDDRHQSVQYGRLLQEDRAHPKTSAEVDARRGTTQSVYSLQSQVAAAEQNVRHVAIQNAYNMQSQVGMTETDPRHKANQDMYSLQNQIRAGEPESRPKSNISPYNLQAQLASVEDARHKASQNRQVQLALAEADARHKASQNAYNLHAQVAMGETDLRHKAGQNMYSLQTQAGMGEIDARHKANHSAFGTQSHSGAGEKDSRYRSSQHARNWHSQVGSEEADLQDKTRQNVYNLQSQVATAEAEARLKASQNAYSLHAQIAGYSQPSSLDGRQGRAQWPLGSQQSNSQSQTSMFVFPSPSGKSQNSQNSANLQAWNASVTNVDNWQKSGAAGNGPFQQADHAQVENVDSRQQNAQSGVNSRHSSSPNENHLQSLSSSRLPSRLGRPNNSVDASLSGATGTTSLKPASLNHWQNHSNSITSNNASQYDVLPTWSQGASPARDVEKFNSAGHSTSGADDGQWSRGQTLASQGGEDQANLAGQSSDVLPTWSRGQSQVEPLPLGGESRIHSGDAQQMWSRGQNILPQNKVEESSSGLNEATPTWSREQNIPARESVEQLNLGELNSEIDEGDLPAWSSGQSGYTRKEVEDLDGGGESNNLTEELPIWSRGQSKVDQSAKSVVDQLDLGEELNSGRDEVVPAWSRGQSKDREQSALTGETNGETDLVPSWSRGQSASVGRDTDEVNVEAQSNMGKSDALPGWSQGQRASSRKDADQLNQAADSRSGGTNHSVQGPLSARPDAEKRAQAEMSFLDRGTQRESNSAASPAPSPDSNLFSTATKQKSATKNSSLSRNTLELLSRPEEPDESSSMNDEEEFQDEEVVLEDSGVNASGISLAHLRRPGQPSGPLSPQGFGLRLAPPSHLAQNAQAGKVGSASSLGVDASRTGPTQTSQEVPESNSTSGNDPALNEQINTQMDTLVPIAVDTSSPLPATSTGTSVLADPQQDSQPRLQEHEPIEIEDTSLPTGELDGGTTQSAGPWSVLNPGVQKGSVGEQQSVEAGQEGPASKFPPTPSTAPILPEDGNVTKNSYNLSQANVMGHLTSNLPQKIAPHSSTTQQGLHTAAHSKLLTTFKDSISGQTTETSAQQQQVGNTPDRGNSAVLESFRSQVGNKHMNGLQPGQWSTDPSKMSSSAKAELFKRLAGQVQEPNQGGFEQMQASNSSPEKTTSGGEAFLGQTTAAGHYSSGQKLDQGQILPEQQAMVSGQSQQGQATIQGIPGQESIPPSPHSGLIYNQSYNQAGHGITMDKSHQDHLQSQSDLLPVQSVQADEQNILKSQDSAGQVGSVGQSYPGQAYASRQALPRQFNGASRSHIGQTFNQSQGHQAIGSIAGKTFTQSNDFPGQPGTPGQALSGPETPVQHGSGQVSSPSVTSEQNKGRQPRKLPQKAAENDVNQTQLQGREVSQQSAGYTDQLSLASQKGLPPQNVVYDHQYGPGAEQNTLSSSVQASQENTPSDAPQPTAVVSTEGLGSMDPHTSDSRGLGSRDPQTSDSRVLGATDKPGIIPARMEGSDRMHTPRSSLELNVARHDSQKGSLLQQWQNAQSLSSQGGISDYQFQRILEARPSLAAALEQSKGNPRLYQLYAAQIRAQMARQMGYYQQHAREQSAALTGSVLTPSAAVQPLQASHALQAAQVAYAQAAHEAQSLHAARAVQAVHHTQLHTAAQAAEAAQAGQVIQAAQAAQAIHATQVAQAGQSGQMVDQAAIISKNANTAARLQYLTQIAAQRGLNVNGMAAPWFSGMVGRPGSGTLLPNRMGEGKGQDAAAAIAPLGTVVERSRNDDLSGSRFHQNSFSPAPPQTKKRKEPSPLPPWREVISQAGGYVSNMSGSELEWATATNRIPEVEPRDEIVDVTDARAVIVSRAKRRLRLTTQLMQQITPAVPARLMQSKTLEDRESGTYTISKLAFADACRISSIARRIREVAAARDAEESRIEKERELAIKEAEYTAENRGRPMPLPRNIADRFKLRMKLLGNDLQRLENSPSAVDLVKDMQDTESMGLVNRLVLHHSVQYAPQNPGSPIRAVPQKYVTIVQVPSRLPEGLLCVSL